MTDEDRTREQPPREPSDLDGRPARSVDSEGGAHGNKSRPKNLQATIQHILSVSPAILYSCRVDPDRRPEQGYPPTYVSPNVTDILGYSVQECVGAPTWWLDNLHRDDVPRVLAEFPLLLFGRGHHEHEYRFRRKDGGWV